MTSQSSDQMHQDCSPTGSSLRYQGLIVCLIRAPMIHQKSSFLLVGEICTSTSRKLKLIIQIIYGLLFQSLELCCFSALFCERPAAYVEKHLFKVPCTATAPNPNHSHSCQVLPQEEQRKFRDGCVLASTPCGGTCYLQRQRGESLCRAAFLLGSEKGELALWHAAGQQAASRRVSLIKAERTLLITSEMGEDLSYSAQFLHRDRVYRLFT